MPPATQNRRGSLLILLLAGLDPACSDDGAAADAAVDHRTLTDGVTDVTLARDGITDGLVSDGPSTSCGSVVTFADGKQPTIILHVSPTGSDSAGDGSAAKPFATLGQAAKTATAGAAVRIHAGTYAGGAHLSGLQGTAAAPIWIGGAPGEARPVLDGGGTGLQLSKVRYLVLHDLELRNATSNGVNCDDGGEVADPDATRYVVLRDLAIHDVGGDGNQDCLKLSGVDDYFVLKCSFARCGGAQSGSGIDHVGCHKGLIVGNTFEQHSGNAIQCKGGSEDIEIRGNVMTDAGERAVNMGGSTGFEYFRPPLSTTAPNVEARDIRVVANLIRGGTAALAFVGCVDCRAANNTIVTPHNWLLRILQETTTARGYTFLPCSNNRVINNIFYFDRRDLSTYVNTGANTQASSFTFANNLWFAYDDVVQSKPTLPVTGTGGIVGQDPTFIGVSGHDYHIGSTSPAAGKGQSLTQVSADLDGQCYASPPSVGAYEAP